MGQLPRKQEYELALLFDMYDSDKGSVYKKKVHTYADTYHALFSPLRHEVTAVFECGVFRGGSLRAWRDYFPNAAIIAGDINAGFLFDEERIHTALLDQMSPDSIGSFFSALAPKYPDKFDIMIDDGCHIYEATLCLFENAIKYLKPNGLYIIEDMLEKYFSSYRDFFKKYIDREEITVEYKVMSQKTGDPHNNLIIIRKQKN
jgi:SAM-dependent methyltransferase